MSRRNIAIGIDLGTSSSCVGVWENGKVEIIPNDLGLRTTASYVAFTDIGGYVGDAAKSQAASNPKNTIHGFKSLLGRSFDDPAVQNVVAQEYCPIRVVNVEDKPNVGFEWNGMRERIAPEDLSFYLLRYLKQTAEAYLDRQVTDAVITVPACFTFSQVKATKMAAKAAGINVRGVINDCAAAAFTYSLSGGSKGSNGHYKENKVLFLNVGGGNTGAAIINVDGEFLEVKATAGNTSLGGDHFDARLVDHLAKEFRVKYKKDIKGNPRALQRLRKECEGAKKSLSGCTETLIQIDGLHEGLDFYTSITRCVFEELCEDLFREVVTLVEEVLREAGMCKTEINDVVLVGGSTRIPRIQRLLQNFFYGKVLNRSLHPDEAPAQGAAILAAIFSGVTDPVLHDVLMLNASEITIGVETAGGVMNTLIPRNTIMPTGQTQVFTTVYDDQPAIIISIFEGEGLSTMENIRIGVLSLTGLAPAPRGIPQINLTIDTGANGTPLRITAVEESTGTKWQIEISHENGKIMSRTEVEQLVLDGEKERKEKIFQGAFGCIKAYYETIIRTTGQGQAELDTYNQKLRELEEEQKKYQPSLEAAIRSLERRGFPMIPFQLGVEREGPESKRRRSMQDPDNDFMDSD